jgi:hypothetical protein
LVFEDFGKETWNNLYVSVKTLMQCELPPPKGSGFLLPRPDSVLIHSRAQFPVNGNVSSSHVWKAGYGGLSLHRRKFGLSQAYVRKHIERKK